MKRKTTVIAISSAAFAVAALLVHGQTQRTPNARAYRKTAHAETSTPGPMREHRLRFPTAAVLVQLETLDDNGKPTNYEAELKARRWTVFQDDNGPVCAEQPVSVSMRSIILRGTLDNAGRRTTVLTFSDGTAVQLAPGESLTIESEQPAPESVIQALTAAMPACFLCTCRCRCDGNAPGTCVLDFQDDADNTCTSRNDRPCRCEEGGDVGVLENCVKIAQPCPAAGGTTGTTNPKTRDP